MRKLLLCREVALQLPWIRFTESVDSRNVARDQMIRVGMCERLWRSESLLVDVLKHLGTVSNYYNVALLARGWWLRLYLVGIVAYRVAIM